MGNIFEIRGGGLTLARKVFGSREGIRDEVAEILFTDPAVNKLLYYSDITTLIRSPLKMLVPYLVQWTQQIANGELPDLSVIDPALTPEIIKTPEDFERALGNFIRQQKPVRRRS